MIKVFGQGGWKDVDIYWDINNEADLKKNKTAVDIWLLMPI